MLTMDARVDERTNTLIETEVVRDAEGEVLFEEVTLSSCRLPKLVLVESDLVEA